MPCPHNEISIVQRSQQQSAVAAAAYQSGEKLFCGYDQEVKHYPEKRGIVHNEILLPANAPRSYADRNTLWNAAEAVEKQWNSQLARRWVLTIPREIPPDQYAALVRDFCNQQFVSKGMCVDFAIHDKGDGNPHAHVMLTMRAMDEHGKWLPKSRKVYDLDENGERIKLPSGRWKSHKEDTVDWNDRKYCEIWRHEWEIIQNRYLEANNRPERVDLRSYERQGLDIIPTVHEGAAVRQMEKRGIQTNIGNLNREIKAANSLMKSIRQLIKNLKGWIIELSEKRKELLAEKAAEEAVFLPNLLMKYMEVRKAERSDWTRAGQNRGTSKDLKAVSEALSYLQRKGLSTVEDLENFIETSGKSAADYRKQMKPKETRSNVIDAILAARTDCKECKPVYEKYQKIFFKKTKEKFKLEHPEVARFEKASAYLAKHPDDKDSTKKELLQEQAKLVGEIADLKVPLTEVQKVLEKRRDIHVIAKKILEAKDLFMIGRGLDYSILLEGSLKLKEVSYIHSEAYASGELKHGPIALITTNTPVVATVTQEKLMSKELSNIKEVKSRGADIVLFIKEALSGDLDTEYQVIRLPDMQDEFMVLPASVALQLLAYYVSSDKGFDVDKPRNLAKVVTVE